VEYRALDDRFRIGLLGYDFTKRDDKPRPRYRITSSFQFWKGLYAQTGVQDLANPELRTFFIGGGIRWTDEDLKKLVGLASAAK
jgi:phospholipid/cholesterol/gamma-HCH transport system substrate-binding protein